MARVEKGRSGRPYRRARATLKAKRLPCHICGQPIDYELPGSHPMGFVMDHVIPLAFNGDPLKPSNLAAAHSSCNGRKGTKAASEVVIIPRSRDW